MSTLFDYTITIKGRSTDVSPEVLKRRLENSINVTLTMKDSILDVEVEVGYTDPMDVLKKLEKP